MARFISRIADRGWLYSLAIVFNRCVPESLFRFRYFHVYRLGTAKLPQHPSPKIEIRQCVDPFDWEDASQLTGRSPSQSANGFGKQIAWLASIEGNSVGAVWIARGEFREPELGLRYLLRDDQQWLFSAHVVKAYRCQGIYSRLLSCVLSDSAAVSTYAAINPVNRSSMIAHRHSISAGASIAEGVMPTPLGSCIAIKCLGISLAWCFGNLRCDRHFVLSHRRRPISIRFRIDERDSPPAADADPTNDREPTADGDPTTHGFTNRP